MNQQEDFYLKLRKKLAKDFILIDEPMENHTSFKVGGPADYLVLPQSTDELIYTLKTCKESDIPYYIMGNGSNLLVSDKGYRGTIIKLHEEYSDVSVEKLSKEDAYKVKAQAGISLAELADFTARQGLKGFEFAAGIPGTLGGAITMNAGAYGGEIKDCIYRSTLLDKDYNLISLENDELELGYRTSIIQKKGYIALEGEFIFEGGNPDEILREIEELNNKRKEKQPLDRPSAGSAFKRPKGHYAGKLIADSGLKGYTIGGAQVSTKHCGFVINKGDAKAADVYNLLQHIKEVVYNKFEVILEQEVKMLGDF